MIAAGLDDGSGVALAGGRVVGSSSANWPRPRRRAGWVAPSRCRCWIPCNSGPPSPRTLWFVSYELRRHVGFGNHVAYSQFGRVQFQQVPASVQCRTEKQGRLVNRGQPRAQQRRLHVSSASAKNNGGMGAKDMVELHCKMVSRC